MAAGFRRQDEHGDREGRSDPCPVQALRKDRIQKLVGARDLNPGHHGLEPCRCRVLRCPTDSRVVLANTESTRLVSFGDPLEPSGAGNA